MSIADDIEASDQYFGYDEPGYGDKIYAVKCRQAVRPSSQYSCSECVTGVGTGTVGTGTSYGYIQECPWCRSPNIPSPTGWIHGRLGANYMVYGCGTIVHVCFADMPRLTAYTRTVQCKLLIVCASEDNII